jgi:hypothetical protein
MQPNFNGPMPTLGLQDVFDWGSFTGDKIADFDFDFLIYLSFGDDHRWIFIPTTS